MSEEIGYTYSGKREAAISDHRFKIPLSPNDEFYPLERVTAGFDILGLKREAEEKGGSRAIEILRTMPFGSPLPEKVWNFITLNRYRRGPKEFTEAAKEKCAEQIRAAQQQGASLALSLSAFPLKVLNPLKTFARDGTEVDLGELGCLLRLYEIAFGLSHLYEPGAKMVVTSDGMKYHDVIDCPRASVEGYLARIQQLIEFLGIGEFIEVVDETTFFPEEYPALRAEKIEDTRRKLEEGDPETVTLFTKLRANLALSLTLSGYQASVETLALAFNHRLTAADLQAESPDALDLRMEVEQRTLEASIQYIGTYQAVYGCNAYERGLPGVIKCTVHPKEGQVGLYPVNKCTDNYFPFHGQGAMCFRRPSQLDSIRVGLAADLLRTNKSSNLRAVVLPEESFPFSNGVHPFTVIDITSPHQQLQG